MGAERELPSPLQVLKRQLPLFPPTLMIFQESLTEGEQGLRFEQCPTAATFAEPAANPGSIAGLKVVAHGWQAQLYLSTTTLAETAPRPYLRQGQHASTCLEQLECCNVKGLAS